MPPVGTRRGSRHETAISATAPLTIPRITPKFFAHAPTRKRPKDVSMVVISVGWHKCGAQPVVKGFQMIFFRHQNAGLVGRGVQAALA